MRGENFQAVVQLGKMEEVYDDHDTYLQPTLLKLRPAHAGMRQ